LALGFTFLGLHIGSGCRRESPPPENPMRQRAAGDWVAGRPNGPAAFANLNL